LNLTTLATGGDRTCGRVEANFQIEVCSRSRRTDLYEHPRHIAAITWNRREVTEEVLADGPLARVPVTDLQLTEWHTASTCVDDIEVGLNLIIASIGISRTVLDL